MKKEPSTSRQTNLDSLLSLPKPTYDSRPLVRVPDSVNPPKDFFSNPPDTRVIPERKLSIETQSKTDEISYYKGTLSSAEADVMYATSVIENSFKSCFECLDMDNNILDEFKNSSRIENRISEDIQTIR